jgi:hypothetical protein
LTFGQELLYKKDNTQLKVKTTEIGNKTIIYTVPEDSLRRVYYISKTLLDSLRLSNGQTLSFLVGEWNDTKPIIKIPVNNVSLDLFNLAYRNINLEYERVFKSGKFGLAASFFYNLNYNSPNQTRYYSIGGFENFNYDVFEYCTLWGVNYFPFNQSLVRSGKFRYSTGLKILMGSVYRFNYWDYYSKPYVDFVSLAIWTNNGRFYINDKFQIRCGLGISLKPLCTIISPEIGVSYGF